MARRKLGFTILDLRFIRLRSPNYAETGEFLRFFFMLRGFAAKDEEEFECRILDVLNSAGRACGILNPLRRVTYQ
jgi:hypothetical protein